LLKQQGLKIVGADFRFEGSSASEEQAAILNLPNRFPLILVQYSLFDSRGKVILEGQSAARSDRMVFDLRTEFSRTFRKASSGKKNKATR
jgi:DNA-binding GntR family transcriptional regulator